MRDLDGRIALVTGGGKGVGKVIARTLAERGAHVIINCFHSYDRAKETRAELEALGASVEVIRASVAREDQVERMFGEIEQRHGHLDILVNNAAAGWLGAVEDITADHFAKALDANLLGSFWCAKRAAPLMARRDGGTIVNVSSIGAGMAMDNYLVVGASKAAVEGLTRHLAVAYAPLGIRVNTASCGLIAGEVAQLFPRAEEMQRVTVAATPLGRLATPEDLAGVVTFLTSDLSRWMTGQVVLADGGLSLGNAMLSPPKTATLPAAIAPAPPAAAAEAPEAPAIAPEAPAVAPAASAVAPAASASPAAALVPADSPEPAPAPELELGDDDPIAVVGMGMVVPGANTPDEYWRLLMDGGELFVDVPAERWDGSAFYSDDPSAPDKTYQGRSGFITGFAPDPELAAELAADSVDHEFTTMWLRHALLQAMRGVHRRDGDRFSFAVGYTADGNQHLEEALVLSGATTRLAALAGDDPASAGLLDAAGRVLNARLHLGRAGAAAFLPDGVGRAAMEGVLPTDSELVMVDTACSSSLYAVDIGVKSLLLGTTDIAVCGGSFALGPRGAVLFSKLHGLSKGGVVRSLDRGADGVLFSDGAGVVTLKRLSRARADGDTVLGIVAGFGSSSDGKGKAIYAPSAAGQQLAVERAMASPGVEPDHIDWVIAHATGTPAGDLAEFTGLRTSMPARHPVQVTSNKSLIGHTGWAAGVVSIIEVLLALRHEAIPGQHRFESAPDAFELDGGMLRISKDSVQWPRRAERPRAASVSGFGFGGTNAHVVLQEDDGRGLPVPAVQADEPIVIVDWSAKLPGLEERSDVERWVRGEGVEPDASFGDAYPTPPFQKVRLPPGTLRTLDRCQLMLLESVFGLEEVLGDFWAANRDRTAVFAGHMGATRNSTLYALRCYLGEMRDLLEAGAPEAWTGGLAELFDRYAEQVRGLVPESNENSFPGIMPNVIPARVANYLDFHGPNMTIDAGLASTLSAFEVAARYLRAGDVDLALVAGINGNATPEAQALLDALAGANASPVAEGVVTFAVVRESTARAEGLPVLARLGGTELEAATVAARSGAQSRTAGYLGAAGAIDLLHAIAGADSTAERGPTEPVEPELLSTTHDASGRPLGVRRYVVGIEPVPLVRVRPERAFAGAGTVVLTDDPQLLAAADVAEGALVLSTRPPAAPAPHVVTLPEVTPAAVTSALQQLGGPVRAVRLLSDVTAAQDPGTASGADLGATLALHDLLFLTVQAASDSLREGGTLATCLLGALPGGEVHPLAGMFTGFVKSATIEMPDCLTYAVLTSSRDAATGIAQTVLESTAEHHLPVTIYDGDRRCTLAVRHVDAPLDGDTPARLGPDSVVLATGGSRGITAVLLKALAARYRPAIYVLGTTDLDAMVEPPSRPEYLREQRERHPDMSVAEINRGYERLQDALTGYRTLAELRSLVGEDRVRYLRADVRDGEAVGVAVQTVLDEAGRIDLVLHTAGINRSALISSKQFEDFRAVRDIKVLGHHNLKRALTGREPAMWCNFSSLVGVTGQVGETDYAAGNDYLATASRYATRVQDTDEFALGWSLWSSVGLGADPVKAAFLERGGAYTGMDPAEGVHHFLRELHLPAHDPSILYMGELEETALLEYRPGAMPEGAPTRERGRFFIDRTLSSSDDAIEFERTFDLERDGYLAEHVVLGHPTLPGTFVTEIAAEAATELAPGRMPIAFEDVVFSSFLRVYQTGRPAPKRIHARVLSHDDRETVVRVRIATDVVSPSGIVLATDKTHFEITVRLRDEMPAAPHWEHWTAAEDGRAMPDPYHMPNPAVLLTGGFVSTRDTRLHALGRRAELALDLDPGDPRFSGFIVPAIMLDGLVRVSVLDPVDDGYVTLAAPAAMRRIDLYESRNDIELAAAYPTLSLYSAPRRIDLEGPVVSNRCIAVAPDGHVVAQIHDTSTAVLGYIHPDSGDFLTPDQMTARRRARATTRRLVPA